MTTLNLEPLNRSLPPLSVVIATLGGESLTQTIECLNSGSVIPDEILVCIPSYEASRTEKFNAPNLRVLKTEVRGQVAQRAIGFGKVKNNFVMQIDDDMIVHYRCLEYLLIAVMSEQKVAVAPVLVNFQTGLSVYPALSKKDYFSSIYYWILNGAASYKPGSIYRSGTAEGVDPWSQDRTFLEVEWLAGGCVMHRRENLILDHFYPFSGKAFYEDIIHSYYLRSKGIKLLISSHAICSMELSPLNNLSIKEFFASLASEFKAKKFFFKISKQSSPRLYLFYLLYITNYFCKIFYKKLIFTIKDFGGYKSHS